MTTSTSSRHTDAAAAAIGLCCEIDTHADHAWSPVLNPSILFIALLLWVSTIHYLGR
jgi:hypothetical protein